MRLEDRMELTQHEQKILDIVKNHPDILDNPDKRASVAELYGLSEKTLRNRIAELKKYGLIVNGSQKDNKKNVPLVQNGEVDLMAILSLLRKRKKFIINLTGFFSMLGVTYALLATVYFQSFISLYPVGDIGQSGGMFGDFQGLAKSFGIGSMGSAPTYNIPDIINSRRLKKDIVLKKWNTSEYPNGINLIEYWEIDHPPLFNPRSWLKSFFTDSKSDASELDKHTQNAIIKLNELISIKEELSGLITVSVLMEEPNLAADVANYIADFVTKFISSEQKREAKRNLAFVDEQKDQAQLSLIESEEKKVVFKKLNQQPNTPEEIMEFERLENLILENRAVYTTLRQQFEIAKIEEAKEKLLVNILDYAEPAVEKSKPKRTFLVILFTFAGFFISCGFVLTKELFPSN